jgi:SAM-dependent methyltransferase
MEQLRPGVANYERNQNYNFITRWLHSARYKHAIDVLARLDCPHIVEIGCGHAKLFGTLRGRFEFRYSGFDLEPHYIRSATTRYSADANFAAYCGDALEMLGTIEKADVICAFETLEHIKEGRVVRIVERIAEIRPRLFLCSVPVEIGPAVWLKNVGSAVCRYPRHRQYTWRETFWSGLYRLDKVRTHERDHIGFDWRWLAQTLRHNFRIREMRSSPLSWLPKAFSTSVFFVCEPRS